MSNSLRPLELQHAMPPCPSPTAGVYPNPCSLSRWCHQTISSSVVPFSSCPQSFPASGSFQMSQLFASGGQSIGVSASTSALPMNIQDWSPLGWTGWISLQSKGLSRVFSNTTAQKHQYFVGSSKKQESFRKTLTFALLTTPKPLAVWITTNCGKFLKRWEYQTTWPVSCEICMQVRKQQLDLDKEQQTGSK